jgi:hypothetical protein
MHQKFILQPHLPQIPNDILEKIFKNNNEYINYDVFAKGVGRTIVKHGQAIPSASNRIQDATDELKDWVTNNITRHWANIGTVETDTDKSVVGAHLDRIRNYSLLYPIQAGGQNVFTVFYRLRDARQPRDAFFYNDYSELEEIARVHVPEHTWCILDTKTIHAVEGLESQRITVQVGLWDYMGLPDIH